MYAAAVDISESLQQGIDAALLGSAALGTALAFGLGGRDVANRMLEDAYRPQALMAGRGCHRASRAG